MHSSATPECRGSAVEPSGSARRMRGRCGQVRGRTTAAGRRGRWTPHVNFRQELSPAIFSLIAVQFFFVSLIKFLWLFELTCLNSFDWLPIRRLCSKSLIPNLKRGLSLNSELIPSHTVRRHPLVLTKRLLALFEDLLSPTRSSSSSCSSWTVASSLRFPSSPQAAAARVRGEAGPRHTRSRLGGGVVRRRKRKTCFS